jgi:feruloyl esterase
VGSVQADECFDLYQLSDYQHAVEPGVVIDGTANLPRHCVVRGVINRAIKFEVRLPLDEWSGRFLMLGTGGSSGYVADTTFGLAQGFAVSSTDTGHQGIGLEYASQPEAALDYAFRGVHLAALTSKKVIERFYGQRISSSFYGGCSNGGRQGLIEATRFPEDFDGIVAVAPAYAPVGDGLLWNVMAYRAQLAGPLTLNHIRLLDETSRASCDTLDGVEDGIINDPRQCTGKHYDPGELLCKEGQDPSTCLTAAQLDTVRQHYRGVVDANGNVISPGLMPGAETAGGWPMWALKGFENPETGELLDVSISQLGAEQRLRTWVYQDPNYDPSTFDIVADRGDLERASAILDVNTADLAEFRERGGKILMVQGWNDYPVRPMRAINYLAEAEAANGGTASTREFFRLFMVPGMGHCGGGPGAHVFDYVSPLVTWVEEGDAPEELIGSRPDGAFTRRHCAFPATASYTGGDVNDAASYRCEVP